MAFLCVSNGRSSTEVTKLLEGELYEIDKYTTRYLNSDQIRDKNVAKLKNFKKNFPEAGNGSIRVFDENIPSENGLTVLYKKHVIAFGEILKNVKFMRFLASEERAKVLAARRGEKSTGSFLPLYELNGILKYNFSASINRLLKILKQRDKDKTGKTGGGQSYFSFMRLALRKYNFWQTENKNHPSIDEMYRKHLEIIESSALKKEPKSGRLVEETLPLYIQEEIPFGIITETDFVDVIGYEEMINPEISPYTFFSSDSFDRSYSDLFDDSHMFILGSSKETDEYKELYEISKKCFDGQICCPILGEDASVYNDFDNSKMNIFYLEEKTRELEAFIARSQVNGASTIIISPNEKILESYREKYKDIETILSSIADKKQMEKDLVESFIRLYNEEYKRNYSR
jgi:hypothetical protein